MNFKQIDCFKINMAYFKILGVWPSNKYKRYFEYYSTAFILIFNIIFYFLFFINCFFLPRQLDIIIDEMFMSFTEVSIISKVLTFLFKRDKIKDILDTLESDTFQPDADTTSKIVKNAKGYIVKYWKIVAVISYTAHFFHVFSPLLLHLFLSVGLELPVCSYSFLPENVKERFFYFLYMYQGVSMHFHMLYNVNIDTFFMGLMTLMIAQLEVLNYKLQHVTDNEKIVNIENLDEREYILKRELDKCVSHFVEIDRFCSLIEDVFSVPMFVQFSMSSCIICVSLFMFTMPAPTAYYVFLSTYMMVMVFQILVPCWFGSRIMETSSNLSVAVYFCDWVPRPRQFKSSMRLFVERMNKPLSITAMEIFPLSLATFTGIMNSAYSFFTLLRHMQTREY